MQKIAVSLEESRNSHGEAGVKRHVNEESEVHFNDPDTVSFAVFTGNHVLYS